jgi:NAD(P)-dependent dehydrogenase (short-subunit alcohol dehydrogenase family)
VEKRTVLVTGAARGIGRATTVKLASAGWEVIAGVRSEADAEAMLTLAPGGVRAVLLDIADAGRLAELEGNLPARLDAVVNNAGIVVGGPVEALALDDLRHQLEVNLTGQVAVTQIVLPRLRRSRGRVVFVSSVSGRIATPMSGAYNASKFALEGLADALRMELAPWRIAVSIVEPAQTDTDLWGQAERELEQTVARLRPEHRLLYAEHIAGFRKTIPRSQRIAVPAELVAQSIERALTDKRPRARYVPARSARAQLLLAAATPTRMLDAILRAGTGVPRRAPSTPAAERR